MTRLVLELDDEVSRRLTARATVAGFSDIVGFVESLVTRELDERDAAGEDGVGPPHLSIGSRAELEQLLLARLDGGPSVPATPEFWADLRQQVERRRASEASP